jgi:hypothetical protein
MPDWANSSRDPISKIPNTKKRRKGIGAGGVTQGVGPHFKPTTSPPAKNSFPFPIGTLWPFNYMVQKMGTVQLSENKEFMFSVPFLCAR